MAKRKSNIIESACSCGEPISIEINCTQRIAELEAYNTRLRDYNAGLAQESCELQAKLATPVLLPPLMDGELCGKYGAKYGAAANAHNNAITACSIAIRGAGFKSEATALKCVGDE